MLRGEIPHVPLRRILGHFASNRALSLRLFSFSSQSLAGMAAIFVVVAGGILKQINNHLRSPTWSTTLVSTNPVIVPSKARTIALSGWTDSHLLLSTFPWSTRHVNNVLALVAPTWKEGDPVGVLVFGISPEQIIALTKQPDLHFVSLPQTERFTAPTDSIIRRLRPTKMRIDASTTFVRVTAEVSISRLWILVLLCCTCSGACVVTLTRRKQKLTVRR